MDINVTSLASRFAGPSRRIAVRGGIVEGLFKHMMEVVGVEICLAFLTKKKCMIVSDKPDMIVIDTPELL